MEAIELQPPSVSAYGWFILKRMVIFHGMLANLTVAVNTVLQEMTGVLTRQGEAYVGVSLQALIEKWCKL